MTSLRRTLTAIAAMVAATACAGTIVVNVDLLSFLPAADRELDYPAAGVGLPPGTSVTVQFPVQEIELPEGFGDVTEIATVQVIGAMDFIHESGDGSFAVRIHFSDSADPFSDPPSITLAGTLRPNVTTSAGFDQPLLSSQTAIFAERSLFMGIEAELTSTEPPLGADLFGTLILQTLVARIEGQENAF